MKKILVTCASGAVGSAVVERLLRDKKLMEFCEVQIAYSHHLSESKLAFLETKWKGQITKTFEFNPERYDNKMKRAFEGVDYCFLVPRGQNESSLAVECMIKACKYGGVSHVVLLSLNCDNPKSLLGQEYSRMEESVMDSRINYTIIRTVLSCSRLLWLKEDIVKGVLPLPFKNSKVAMLNDDDIGLFVTEIFSKLSKYCGKTLKLTGPILMSGEDMAKVYSEVLLREIQYKSVTKENSQHLLELSGVGNAKVFKS
jgi:uncharacterized protein YbjT (DUF2867 family)